MIMLHRIINLLTNAFVIFLCFFQYAFSLSKDFSNEFYKQMIFEKNNFIISPINTEHAFAILSRGAKGKTHDEIFNVFGFDKTKHQINCSLKTVKSSCQSDSNFTLYSAAALWPDKRFLLDPIFLKNVNKLFNVKIRSLNFIDVDQTCQTINSWASEQTKGNISNIISPSDIEGDQRLVLTSTLYFKAKWHSLFLKQSTAEKPFYIDNKTTIMVPTMCQRNSYKYADFNGIQVLELDYCNNNYSMIIALPDDTINLSQISKYFPLDSINVYRKSLGETQIDVHLPRFNFSYKTNLIDILKPIGIKKAFDSTVADFSGISSAAKRIFIGDAQQFAKINVDEEGSEASAVDIIGYLMGDGPTPMFNADRPFLFIIYDKVADCVLFIGHVTNPIKT